MKRVLITACMLAVTSIGLATIAQAVQVHTKDEPFVSVSPSTQSLDLGTAYTTGLHTVDKALTLKVQSNCLHGPIKVSVTDLKGRFGNTISHEKIFVRSMITGGFVSLAKPVAVSRPQVGSHDIVLDLQVETGLEELAGKYEGSLVVTLMPPV